MTTLNPDDDAVNILLVDDRPANLIALESFLNYGDYHIVAATSGKEALELVRLREFAVILTDVMMPEMDGLQLAREIKRDEALAGIPIIFLTAKIAGLGDVFRGYEVGAVDYLQKPLDTEIVKAKVAVFAQLFRQKRLIKRQVQQLLASERREQEYRVAAIERQALLERERIATTNRMLEERVALQQALAKFSHLALLRGDIDELMREAASVARTVLGIQMSSLLTLKDGTPNLLYREGSTWRPDLLGPHAVQPAADAWFSAMMEATSPVHFNNAHPDTQLDLPPVLTEHGVVAGASVAIHGGNEPFGALSLFSRSPRQFSEDEMHFLQAIGNVLGIACERQKSEAAVRDLTRSNNELEQFSYAASHDLQEPLRKMSSFSQLLMQDFGGVLTGEGQMYLEAIVDGANRMKVLIDELLDLSLVGMSEIKRTDTPLGNAVADALSNLQVQIEECQATISVPALPTLAVDPSEMNRLFQNLFSNALKYRTDTPPVIEVTAERLANKDWRFCVRDNGIGIDPQNLDKIFVVFKRLHGRGRYPGTGIGLALCKKIVERHGGRIWAKSAGHGGTSFYFTLPASKSSGEGSSAA